MISIANLEKTFGERTLFADVSLQLNPGNRYGLIGANGSGKTTLLSILAGDMEPSSGTVTIGKRLRLGVLRQDQSLHAEHSILNVALMGHEALWRVMVEKEELLANAETHFDADRFSELEERIQHLDGYSAEARAAMILEGLGLPAKVHHNPLSTLSGGFRLRVLLAQVLAGSPDILLLDEPTNHLDILSIRWLETFLRDFPGPAVIISHDHRFLDNACTQILDVDYQTVTLYRGGYTQFLTRKVAERKRREKDIANREREISHHQQFIDRFRAKASKARQAGSKQRLIEKMAESIVELPPTSRRYPTFRFPQARHSGRDVLTVKGVTKAFGDNEVLHGVDLQVQRGDRLAIMGPNGIGKSTLLKIIMDELDADAGNVNWGYEAHPGYFAQDHQAQFAHPAQTAEGWIWEAFPDQTVGAVRANLALVLFSGDEVEKRVSTLSGGEAARLVFCRLAMAQPNVLVLDEPTNHLDLESIEALVEGLKAYEGTLVLVSHDRWFVSQLATRIVEIRPGGIRDFHGTYEEYVHACGDDHLDADRVVLKARTRKQQQRADARALQTATAATTTAARASTTDAETATAWRHPPRKGALDNGARAAAEDSQASRRRGKKNGGAKIAGDRRSSIEGRRTGRDGSGDQRHRGSGKGGNGKARRGNSKGSSKAALRRRRARQQELLDRLEVAEKRMRAIDALFCAADFYTRTPAAEIKELQVERSELERDIQRLSEDWES